MCVLSAISVFHILELIETDIYRPVGFSKISGYPCQQGDCYYDKGYCDNESRFHISTVACEIWNNQEKYVRKNWTGRPDTSRNICVLIRTVDVGLFMNPLT